MIPQRFVTEYPQRCGHLLEMLEPKAREANLVGSFSLLIASAAFTIPFARITESNHPFGGKERKLSSAIRNLTNVSFLEAPFWGEQKPVLFRYARIVNSAKIAGDWKDSAGAHPICSTENKDGNTVLRTIRNALAHGNVVYLDENGRESADSPLRYLAFISKHDDKVSFRVAIFGEEDFLIFLKAWIAWLRTFPSESAFVFLEAAE